MTAGSVEGPSMSPGGAAASAAPPPPPAGPASAPRGGGGGSCWPPPPPPPPPAAARGRSTGAWRGGARGLWLARGARAQHRGSCARRAAAAAGRDRSDPGVLVDAGSMARRGGA